MYLSSCQHYIIRKNFYNKQEQHFTFVQPTLTLGVYSSHPLLARYNVHVVYYLLSLNFLAGEGLEFFFCCFLYASDTRKNDICTGIGACSGQYSK